MRDELRRTFGGERGWHQNLILEAGTSFTPASMDAEDAQFLLTSKFEVVEIARFLNLPPHLLRDLDRSTFSNHEQESLEYLSYSLLPWLKNIEQSINRQVIVQRNRFFCEFLLDELVRSDISSRYQAYSQAISVGWMSRNEVRSLENRNEEPGLDDYLVAQNMGTVQRNGAIQPNNRPQLPPGGTNGDALGRATPTR